MRSAVPSWVKPLSLRVPRVDAPFRENIIAICQNRDRAEYAANANVSQRCRGAS